MSTSFAHNVLEL